MVTVTRQAVPDSQGQGHQTSPLSHTPAHALSGQISFDMARSGKVSPNPTEPLLLLVEPTIPFFLSEKENNGSVQEDEEESDELLLSRWVTCPEMNSLMQTYSVARLNAINANMSRA